MTLKPDNEFNARRRDYGLSYWARDTEWKLYFVGSRIPATPGPIPPDLLKSPCHPLTNG
jgi:hypothetical protein